MDIKKISEYFRFLDEVREAGFINMFGASRVLEESFNLNKKDASSVLTGWMKTFDEDLPAAKRAEKYVNKE